MHCSLSDRSRRWAWNNPHITKKIAPEQRITFPKYPKKGNKRKRPVKPQMQIKDLLSNLHLLLRVPSFARWPLQVRFFCEDVYGKWQKENQRVNATIRSGIKVTLDSKKTEEVINHGEPSIGEKANGKRKRHALGNGGIEGLALGYSELQKHVEKSSFSLAEDEALKCAVCANSLGSKATMALVCPHKDCRTASHVTCLATKFVKDEGVGAAVTPISGRCPGCKVELQWIDLIKELSLRARGQNELVKMMKKPKERKTKQAHNFEEDVADPDEDLVGVDLRVPDASDESLPDNWDYQDHDDGVVSVLNGHSTLSYGAEAATTVTKRPSTAPKLPAVIEDSELDDAEFSD